MKTSDKIIFSFIISLLFFACSPKEADQPATEISADEFEEIISQNDNVVILDVRTPEEFSGGYIKEAQLINFFDEDFQSQIEKLDKDKIYVVYCKSGMRQSQAANMMEGLGFKKVYLLEGGIDRWIAEGRPLNN